jgi:hypothetical protein
MRALCLSSSLLLLSGCAESVSATGRTAPLGAGMSTSASGAPAPHIQAACLSGSCGSVLLSVTTGAVLLWELRQGSSTVTSSASTLTVSLSTELSEVTAWVQDAAGINAVLSVALVALPTDGTGEAAPLAGITILGLDSCHRIPVSSVGGCISPGVGALWFDIFSTAPPQSLMFSPSAPEDYIAETEDEHVAWFLDGEEGFAPGTAPEVYAPDGEYAIPVYPDEHFTFFFGLDPGETNDLLFSHAYALGGQRVYAQKKMVVTCMAGDAPVVVLAPRDP